MSAPKHSTSSLPLTHLERELLEALEAVVREIVGETFTTSDPAMSEAMDLYRAAVAKARGQS